MQLKQFILGFGFVLGTILLIGIVFYLLFDSNLEIQKRTRTHFNIPRNTRVNSISIKNQILSQVPLGSSQKEVDNFVEKIGLNHRPLSGCESPKNSRREILCTIRFNNKKINFSLSPIVTYNIRFYFDLDNKLEEVLVRQTGASL